MRQSHKAQYYITELWLCVCTALTDTEATIVLSGIFKQKKNNEKCKRKKI